MRIAVPRGRLNRPSWDWLHRAGLPVQAPAGRQLWTEASGVEAVEVRGRDMPALLAGGVVDAAIVGRDVLEEAGLPVACVLPLHFGHCRLVAAVPGGRQLSASRTWRVATRYPRITRQWMAARGYPGEVVTMSGAVEAACWLGLADAVVDVVETGATLAANGLVAVETVMESAATLSAPLSRVDAVREWLETWMPERGAPACRGRAAVPTIG